MDELILKKIDLEKYVWKDLPPSNGFKGRIRLLSGGEIVQDTMNRYNKGFQTLFFAFYVDLTSKHSASAVTDSWLSTTPIPLPTSSSDVAEWADNTFIVHKVVGPDLDLNSLRSELGQSIVPSKSGAGFIFHTHHAPFDGVGVKIVANIFLKEFASALGGAQIDKGLEWGTEMDNLLPAACDVLRPTEPIPIHPGSDEEPTFNHPFYSATRQVMQAFANSAQTSYNLKPRQGDPGWPTTHCQELTFSNEESATFLKSLKGKNGSYTVAHAAHSALVMVNVYDNPPSLENSSKFVSCQFLVNARQYLQEPYPGRNGYPGYALSVVPHGFPLSLFFSQSGDLLPLDKKMLVTLMRLARPRDIYNGLKEMPVAFSFMIPASDIFAVWLKQLAASGNTPDNTFRLSHDGAGEAFLDRHFQDSSGQTLPSLKKFFISLNLPDPGPYGAPRFLRATGACCASIKKSNFYDLPAIANISAIANIFMIHPQLPVYP
ncbi:hypothetical protein D9757_007781 [Collybiopsis confluens]|uniref:Condensation domain-containing protein n=1 Tax=Collybiopsis confluens TaxID=2823264 RepID=A0A8H5HPX3_9AGAR|nr:hypothetical protein D9757_007781 [Collybiopsis confluens]